MTLDWWTLGLQTINFLVLAWILSRFFFRPVRRIIAERQQAAGKALANAEAMRNSAAQAETDAKKARSLIDSERDALLSAAHAEAERDRERLLADAKRDAEKIVGEAKAAGLRERAAMEQQLTHQARDLSIDIARRLLTRLPPAAAMDMFVQALCGQIAQLKPETQVAFTAPGSAVEVVTAAALSPDAQPSLRKKLESAFGGPLDLSFRADPAVIAGIELNAPHAYIRSSWREDLDRIHNELNSDTAAAR